jgi:hypothetical protein
MRGIFDTGSSNAWILSTWCDNYEDTNLLFNPDLSNTFRKTDLVEEVCYGSGDLNGVYGYDDFYLGEPSDDGIHIKDHMIGIITSNTVLKGNKFDAIIGLAFEGLVEHG